MQRASRSKLLGADLAPAPVTSSCPGEETCPCPKGKWCRQKRERAVKGHHDYRMMTLEGCEDGHCDQPCTMLTNVEQLAGDILARASVTAPPVPLDLLKSFDPTRRLEIRLLPLHAHYGATWLVDDEWVMHLNSNQSPAVNRFVAFHEGYHILHRTPAFRAADVADGCRTFCEEIADYFAASMLMPTNWVLDLWPRIQDADAMARLFDVPEPAMRSWIHRWLRPA